MIHALHFILSRLTKFIGSVGIFVSTIFDTAINYLTKQRIKGNHPAESSENTSICAKIRKYVPIDWLWWMFSQPHFEEGAIKIHVISIASICPCIISQRRLDV